MGWIRGEVHSRSDWIYLCYPPMPSIRLFKIALENGDTLSFDGMMNGPTSARIVFVYNLKNTYIVKLDRKLSPYFDFRKNIVNIIRKNSNDEKQERLLNVDNIITIDLFKSAVIKECLHIKFKENYERCLRKLNLSNFDHADARWIKESRTNDKIFDDFGLSEMWNKGGSLNIQYATNIVKKVNTPTTVSAEKETSSSILQSSRNSLIWEIYPSSLLNIFYGTHNPAPTEMLIHVLGRETREKYYSSFVKIKPEYISFAKPERFTPWLINWHWRFFRNMVNNYDLVVDKNEFSLWHLNKNNKWNVFGSEKLRLQGNFPVNKPIGLDISNVKTNSCDIKLMTAVVKYEIENPISSIPLVGKLSRYLLEIEDTGLPSNLPVSLPWSENTFSFPIFYRDGFNPVITPRILSNFLDLTLLDVKEITLYRENVDANNIYSLYYDYPTIGAAARFGCNDISPLK